MIANCTSEKMAHPFLSSFSPENLEIILHKADTAEFANGQLILQEGEPANRMYLIQNGRVAVEAGKQGERIVQVLGPGETLGWSWLFPPFSWNFSARAIEPTTCVVLDGGHLLVTAEENSKFGYELMRRITEIVIGRLQATRKKMLETPIPQK